MLRVAGVPRVRTHVAEPWVEAPLQAFVDDARVLFALLLHPSGQVLGQFGFTRAVDVMAACALAAAHPRLGRPSSGRELDGKPFRELHHAGRDRQSSSARCARRAQRFIFLTVVRRRELARARARVLRRALRDRLAMRGAAAAGATPLAAAQSRAGPRIAISPSLFGRAPRGRRPRRRRPSPTA